MKYNESREMYLETIYLLEREAQHAHTADIAKLLGISYEELNIWLFVVMAPTAMAVSVMMNIVLAWKIRGYRKRA